LRRIVGFARFSDEERTSEVFFSAFGYTPATLRLTSKRL
jgi:hypothetical protein